MSSPGTPVDSSGQITKAKRSRAGCLSCRRRHKKCDEAKPICKNCEQRNAFCEWPIKGIFKTKNINSKKKANTERPHFHSQVPGTNYHQIINGELDKLLGTAIEPGAAHSTSQSTPAVEDSQFNYASEFQNPIFFDASLDMFKKDAAADTSLVDFVESLSNSTNQPQNRSDSISSNSPSLFSNTYTGNINNHNNSSFPATDGSSPASDIDHHQCCHHTMKESATQLEEDFLLKSFQVTSSSQFLKVPDSSKFEASHKVFGDFLLTNVMLNKQQAMECNTNTDLSNDLMANLMLSEFHISLQQDSEELKSKNDRQKEQYFKLLFNQANRLLEMTNKDRPKSGNVIEDLTNDKDINFNPFTLTFCESIVSIQEKNKLVRNFITNVMPLLQLSSCAKKLINKVLVSALTSDTNKASPKDDYLICSILALSSRIKDLKSQSLFSMDSHNESTSNFNKNTLKLYNKALKLLIYTMRPKDDNSCVDPALEESKKSAQLRKHDYRETIQILCSCLLLFFFQILSSSPKHYKGHLQNMLLFVKSYEINGFNNQLGSSNRTNKTLSQLFWLIVRLDLHFSISFNEPTSIESKAYLPKQMQGCSDLNEIKQFFLRSSSQNNKSDSPKLIFDDDEEDEIYADSYGNYLCYLSARIMELIHNVKNRNYEEYTKEWSALAAELQAWHDARPIELQSIVNNNQVDNSNHSRIEVNAETFEIKFPIILYNDAVSTFVNQLYHTVSILLYQNEGASHTMNQVNGFDSLVEESKLNNLIVDAIKVIGISLNDANPASLTYSLPFNYIASNLLTKNSNRKTNGMIFYYDSKIIMKKLLKNEQKNAWPLRWKFSDF